MKIKLRGDFDVWVLVLVFIAALVCNVLIAMGLAWVVDWVVQAFGGPDLPYWPTVVVTLLVLLVVAR